MTMRLVLSAALLAASASALAADPLSPMSATASITGLSYRLIDLDTTDGITPWVQFQGASVVSVSSDATGLPAGLVTSGTLFSLPAGGHASPTGEMTGSYSPTQVVATLQVNGSTVLNGLNPGVNPPGFGLIGITGMVYGSDTTTFPGYPMAVLGDSALTLSPHTALVIEGVATQSVALDLGKLDAVALQTGANAGGYSHVSADVQSGVTVRFSGLDPSAPPVASYQQGLYLTQDWNAGVLGSVSGNTSKTESFSVQLSNTGADALAGGLEITALLGASAAAYAAPTFPPIDTPAVPESSTVASMALGMGLMAWRLRRRSL